VSKQRPGAGQVAVTKVDLRKQLRSYYQPSTREVTIVDIPPMPFLLIDGVGDPNTAQEYHDALQALYGLSYTPEVPAEEGAGAGLHRDAAGGIVVDARHERIQP
jgi:hypothetical protein